MFKLLCSTICTIALSCRIVNNSVLNWKCLEPETLLNPTFYLFSYLQNSTLTNPKSCYCIGLLLRCISLRIKYLRLYKTTWCADILKRITIQSAKLWDLLRKGERLWSTSLDSGVNLTWNWFVQHYINSYLTGIHLESEVDWTNTFSIVLSKLMPILCTFF